MRIDKAVLSLLFGIILVQILVSCSSESTEEHSSSSSEMLISSSSSSEIPSSSSSAANAFTDYRDNKTYKWVKIGSQFWMAENLDYNENGSACYDNDPEMCKKYGRLYHWPMAMNGICPEGWHIPSDAEISILINYVEGYGGDTKRDSTSAGAKLKADSGWIEDYGTDDYNFAALPGGKKNSSDKFIDLLYDGFWWSSTENNTEKAYSFSMEYNRSYAYRLESPKVEFLSVRCMAN